MGLLDETCLSTCNLHAFESVNRTRLPLPLEPQISFRVLILSIVLVKKDEINPRPRKNRIEDCAFDRTAMIIYDEP